MTVDEIAREAFGDDGYDWLVEATRQELMRMVRQDLALDD